MHEYDCYRLKNEVRSTMNRWACYQLQCGLELLSMQPSFLERNCWQTYPTPDERRLQTEQFTTVLKSCDLMWVPTITHMVWYRLLRLAPRCPGSTLVYKCGGGSACYALEIILSLLLSSLRIHDGWWTCHVVSHFHSSDWVEEVTPLCIHGLLRR